MSPSAPSSLGLDARTLAAERLAPSSLRRGAIQFPDRVAVLTADGTHALTYQELDARVDSWAVALAAVGLGPGDHVATLVRDPVTAAIAWLGCCRNGALEVPLNPALRGPLLAQVLDDAGVCAVVAEAELAERLDEVADQLDVAPRVLLVDSLVWVDDLAGADPLAGPGEPPVSPREAVAFGDVLRGVAGRRPPERAIESHDIAAMVYTSGTTGRSKGVLVPWGAIHSMWSWPPGDALRAGELAYSTMPLHHLSGKSVVQAVLDRGAGWVSRERFSVEDFIDDIRRSGAVAASLVGPMTGFLMAQPERPDDADTPLRAILCGPMIPETAAFEQRFGVRVATCYGMTEVGAVLATGWDHGPLQGCGRVRDDFPWPEVRLVDEHDREVPPGTVGEMIVRTDAMWALTAGYHGNPEATASAWRNGWFHTGDAFTVDEDGWFTFVDRLKDTIRRRGENISSFEVEGIIATHPDVAECAVVGVPGEHGDEDVVAYVIAGRPEAVRPDALHHWLGERLPSLLRPRYIEVVDDLPRNATTLRVRKHELRERRPGAAAFDAAAPRSASACSTSAAP